MKRRIRNIFFIEWGILGLALLVLGGIMVQNLYYARQNAEEEERRHLLVQTRVISENLSWQLQGTDAALLAIRDNISHPIGGSDISPEKIRQLQVLNETIPGIRTLLVIDSDGIVRMSNRSELHGIDVKVREFYQIARSNPDSEKLLISPPFKTLFGVWGINLSRVILDSSGQFAGVVSATLDPEYFKTLLGSVNYAPDMWTSIAHGDGIQFLMVPGPDEQIGQNLYNPGSFFTRHKESGKKENILYGMVYATGEERMMALNTFQLEHVPLDRPLVIAVSRSWAALQENWYKDVKNQIYLFLMIAVSFIFLLAFFQQRRSKQFEHITEAEDRLKQSNQRLALQYEISHITSSSGLVEGMRQILQIVGKTLGYPFAELWIYEASEESLKWSLCWQDGNWADFAVKSEHLTFCKGEGLPGMILDTEQPVWIENLAEHPNFIRKQESSLAGLQAAFGFPIWVEGKMVGVVIFFSPHIQKIDYSILSLLSAIGIQIGSFYQRKQSEEQLYLWMEIFKNSSESILITDFSGTILVANEAFCHMTGYELSEFIGKNPRIFKSDRHDKTFFREMWHSLEYFGSWQGEIWDRRKNGEIYPKWSIISKIRSQNNENTFYFAIYTDLSEKKMVEEQLHYLRNFDLLTNIPNRNLLNDRLSIALSQAKLEGKPLAVFCLNLDRFKQINNSLGHAAGDDTLREIAVRLKDCLREFDTVSRWGGDEFILVISYIDSANMAADIAKRVLECISRQLIVSGTELNVSASIGISLYPDDGSDVDLLLKNAASAMREAKKRSQNSYSFFASSMNHAISQRLFLEMNLRKALEQQEFVVYYQPQIDIQKNQLMGFEALIRWNQPGTGLVAPSQFLPIAEETGLIIPLGNWVVQEVCRQCREWAEVDFSGFTVAVNISAVQFSEPDFINQFIKIVAESGLSPSCLEAEITEGIIMEKGDQAIDDLNRLKQYGFQLSIDDFGTGYSSLSYLSRFPIDKLKIDQTFIRAMMNSEVDAAIVDSIISLGNNLGMKVIAEGVERQEELQCLRSKGCEEVQGYYYSRPLPGASIIPWLAEAKRQGLLQSKEMN